MAEAKLILRFGNVFSRSGYATVNDSGKATSPLANDKYLVVVVCEGYCIFQTLNSL